MSKQSCCSDCGKDDSCLSRPKICCIITTITILGVCGCFIYLESKPLWQNYEFNNCTIHTIKYPNMNTSDSKLWQSCSCGNDCKSIAPCIKMYVHFNNSNSDNENIFIYEKYNQKHNKCTFWKSTCKPATEMNMIYYLDEAKKTYQSYINKTVDCYYNTEKNVAYMSLDATMNIIIIAIIGSIMFIVLCFCLLAFTF